jgi:hypothetical protein
MQCAYAHLEAKDGKEGEVEAMLKAAQPLVVKEARRRFIRFRCWRASEGDLRSIYGT